MSSKEILIETAKTVLWEQGFKAMSPRTVLEESGIGQGSLYHHFKRKEDLAYAALESIADDLLAAARGSLLGEGTPLERLKAYLSLSRPALKGCRIGRLVSEAAVISSSLKKPVARYFQELKALLIQVITEAKEVGELPQDTDATSIAELIMASIQGGYVIARGQGSRSSMLGALNALIGYLDTLAETSSRTRFNDV